MSILIYSATIGPEYRPRRIVKQEGASLQTIYAPQPIRQDISARHHAKELKMLPHEWVNDPHSFQAMVWVDGNFEVNNSHFGRLMAAPIIDGDADLVFFRHPSESCIYNEAAYSFEHHESRYNLPKLAEQLDFYKGMGLKPHTGVWCGGCFAIRNTLPAMTFMTHWYAEMSRWTLKDQTALAYLMNTRLGNLRLHTIDDDIYKSHIIHN